MKATTRNILFRKLDRELRDAFQNIKSTSTHQQPGDRIYSMPVSTSRDVVIQIIPHPVQEKLGIWCGWCRKGAISEWLSTPICFPLDIPGSGVCASDTLNDFFRFSLSFLWMPNDHWWLVENCSAREKLDAALVANDPMLLIQSIKDYDNSDVSDVIDVAVHDIVGRLKKHLLPFVLANLR